MMDPILTTENIRKTFPGVIALDDVSIEVYPGEVLSIVGENGAGKSTLMKILSGAYTEYEGRIYWNGNPVTFSTPRAAEETGIAIIYQELNLVPDLSVAENIFLGREPITDWKTLDRKKMRKDASKLLARLNCKTPPEGPLYRLRLGQQQLVEVAKALSLNAQVLIMDEPTSALTDQEAQHLFEVIESMKTQNMAIIYISHKMEEVFSLSDRVTVFRDGKVIGTRKTSETSPDEIITMMVGRELDEVFPVGKRQFGEEVLRVEEFCTAHPTRPGEMFLKEISITLRRGEILGIAGLMGAGRSEFLEAIFGAPRTPITKGRIYVDDQEISIKTPLQAIDSGLALVTEDRKGSGLFLQMSVGQNISISALRKLTTMGWIHSHTESRLNKEYVDKLSIKTPSLRVLVENLSGGNQQKAILARWLLTNPKILLLDDPTRGIDVGAKAELYQLMNDLAAEGLGIIMASSELPELLALCDRIVVFSNGEQTGELSREEASEESIMAMATGHIKACSA